MSTIFDIPELVLMIAGYLDLRELARAVRVNKAWYRDITPVLWHTLDCRDHRAFYAPESGHPLAAAFSRPDARRALTKYGHHIRTIQTASFEILESLKTSAPGCTQLTTLQVLDYAFDDAGWAGVEDTNVVVNVHGAQEADTMLLPGGGAAESIAIPEGNNPEQDQDPDTQVMQDVNTQVITHGDFDDDVDEYRSSVVRWDSARLDVLLDILHRNPHLEKLVMYDFPSFHESAIRALLSERLPNLRVLNLCAPASAIVSSRLFAFLLEGLSRRVEDMSLVIRTLADDLAFAPDDPRVQLNYGLEEPTLEEQAQDTTLDYGIKTLEIYGKLAQHGVARTLLPFLRHCPELEHLTMRGCFFEAESQYIEVLRRHCPALHKLRVMRDVASDREIEATLRASRGGWRTLELAYSTGFGALSSQAIVQDHAATLTVLNIAGCVRFSSAMLQRLLETAPNLKRLDAFSEGNESEMIDPWLEAQDVSAATVDWACLGLELFSLKVRVPRPDVVVEAQYVQTAGPPTPGTIGAGEIFNRMPRLSQEECRLLQGEVYRQLGRLVHLKQLWLGNYWDEDHSDEPVYSVRDVGDHMKKLVADSKFQVDCLEMTLASGLETLSGLKELESVDITRMACFLEPQDVSWMTRAWPRLKELAGLRGDIAGWNNKNKRWLRSMRPDISWDIDR